MAGAALKFGKKAEVNVAGGVMWGLGGFVTFFAAPSVGIAPELPGVTSVALELRQWWWTGAVICSGVGLYLAYVLKNRWKWGLLVGLLSAPHIYGAPQAQNPYQGLPSVAAVQLSKMSKDFFLAAGLSSLTLWLVLGIFLALTVKRYIDIEN
jgi:predicted cobalt transporter CbtA